MDNLAAIVADGELRSDATMIASGKHRATIGMSKIKERRLGLPIDCHPGCHVGEFMPFYFCPRSIMLYGGGPSASRMQAPTTPVSGQSSLGSAKWTGPRWPR